MKAAYIVVLISTGHKAKVGNRQVWQNRPSIKLNDFGTSDVSLERSAILVSTLIISAIEIK